MLLAFYLSHSHQLNLSEALCFLASKVSNLASSQQAIWLFFYKLVSSKKNCSLHTFEKPHTLIGSSYSVRWTSEATQQNDAFLKRSFLRREQDTLVTFFELSALTYQLNDEPQHFGALIETTEMLNKHSCATFELNYFMSDTAIYTSSTVAWMPAKQLFRNKEKKIKLSLGS